MMLIECCLNFSFAKRPEDPLPVLPPGWHQQHLLLPSHLHRCLMMMQFFILLLLPFFPKIVFVLQENQRVFPILLSISCVGLFHQPAVRFRHRRCRFAMLHLP
jgi:hypothetical protein